MKIPHLIAYCAVFMLSACGNKQENKSDAVDEIVVTEAVADQASAVKLMAPAPSSKYEDNRLENNVTSANSQIAINKQKIIKDGSMTVKSRNISDSKKRIDQLLKKLNAYYESEDLQNNEQSVAYNLKIRIPSASFEQLIAAMENGEDKIEAKNLQARDVTEEYVDIETRLATKRQYLLRYKQILAKAATVKDILAIEENIRTLEEEIDSQQGRLKYLADQVAFSTLNISLYQEKEYLAQPKSGFLTRTKVALNDGWQSIVGFVLWAVSIWPYLIILFGLYFVVKRIIKIRRARANATN
ncbi:MAG: DUF4349 domain-containing protein [Pedobacter sp.]|uniref:DUF4349 domain-containing protein n=1 Tax=Pedobacter sp. TaxID=1411316 RepID=UPI0028081C9E|nr:DUF4349 domain-containing protein [Pedobacter sp.]MDQ8004483.1 DUF4349 domain-containing protein [Pedobacter sp.]